MQHDLEFLTIYRTHRGELVHYASRYLRDHSNAEDVVQEAYLRLCKAGKTQVLKEPLAYLFRIVRNLALDFNRRTHKEMGQQQHQSDGSLERIQDPAPSPESAAGLQEELDHLEKALSELPDRTRIALEMHRFGNYTLREISQHLEISVGLAHALVADGLQHCQRRLTQRDQKRI